MKSKSLDLYNFCKFDLSIHFNNKIICDGIVNNLLIFLLV